MEKLEPGKIDETKITELKTLLSEIKEKGITADLTDTNKKIEELTEKAGKETDNKVFYLSIGGCIFGGLSFLLALYTAFLKPQKNSLSRENDK